MRTADKRWTRPWLVAIGVHFVLSLGGAWLLSIVAFAIAESNYGPAPSWLAPLERLTAFVLLQPFAYWVFAVTEIRYWTWLGLAVSTLVIAINSGLAIAIARAIARRLSQRSKRNRP